MHISEVEMKKLYGNTVWYLDKAEEDDDPGSKQAKAERPGWTSKL